MARNTIDIINVSDEPHRAHKLVPGVGGSYITDIRPVAKQANTKRTDIPPRSLDSKHVTRLPVHHLKAHAAEPGHALNRKSVKVPTVDKKPRIKHSRPIDHSARAPSRKSYSSLIKLSTANIDSHRSERASQTSKSASITRFNPVNVTNNTSVNVLTTSANSETKEPIRESRHVKTGRTFDIMSADQPTASSATAAATAETSTPVSQFGALVEKSEQSSQHRYLEYTPVKKRRGWSKLRSGQRRAMAFGALGLAIVLLASFIFYEQKANIELQLADSKAGINASLPGYKPSGYSIGKFNYQPGLVAINYNSSADGHYYQLIQKSSSIGSQTLASQLNTGDSYEAVNAGAHTIYISTGNTAAHAAWISGGILYQIRGNASLSQDQIIKIATAT